MNRLTIKQTVQFLTELTTLLFDLYKSLTREDMRLKEFIQEFQMSKTFS